VDTKYILSWKSNSFLGNNSFLEICIQDQFLRVSRIVWLVVLLDFGFYFYADEEEEEEDLVLNEDSFFFHPFVFVVLVIDLGWRFIHFWYKTTPRHPNRRILRNFPWTRPHLADKLHIKKHLSQANIS